MVFFQHIQSSLSIFSTAIYQVNKCKLSNLNTSSSMVMIHGVSLLTCIEKHCGSSPLTSEDHPNIECLKIVKILRYNQNRKQIPRETVHQFSSAYNLNNKIYTEKISYIRTCTTGIYCQKNENCKLSLEKKKVVARSIKVGALVHVDVFMFNLYLGVKGTYLV